MTVKGFFSLTWVFVVCAFFFSVSVHSDEPLSAEESKIAEDLSGIAQGISDELDSDIARGLSGDNIESIEKALLDFLTPEEILKEILCITERVLPDAIGLFLEISGLILISGVTRAVCASATGGEMSVGIDFVCTTAIVAAIITIRAGSFDAVALYFERLNALVGSMIPITGTILAMGGNLGSASVSTVGLYAMVGVTQKLCAATVLPVCYVMEASAVCCALSGGGLLGGFIGAVKKIYNFFVGIVMAIFVFSLGAQTVIANAADTVAARGGKLIASTVIPVIGGAVGDTLRTLAGSVGYIKSVVGIGGILLLAILTLPVLISLLLTRLVFLVTGALAQMLGCRLEGELLGELGNVYAFLIGTVSICSIAFCVAFALFLKCAVAVG